MSVFSNSTQMLDNLKEIQVQRNNDDNTVGIVNDIVMRWWSTYLIFEQILKLKIPARQLYYEELDDDARKEVSTLAKCRLTKDNWEYLANINHILEPFKEGQQIYEAHKHVTLSPVPIFAKNPPGAHGS
jgi:hypothetical protein